jgi:hypothetical protein
MGLKPYIIVELILNRCGNLAVYIDHIGNSSNFNKTRIR